MSSDTEKLLTKTWERYAVPETGVSAEFPEEPFFEEAGDDEDPDDSDDGSIALAAVCGKDSGVIHFDLVVSPAQMLITSSDNLAQQLRKELATDPDLELLGVEPRSCGDLCGAVQRMHLRDSGDFLTQWVIAAPECTIFAGVTSLDVQNEAVVEKFLGSIEVESFDEEEG